MHAIGHVAANLSFAAVAISLTHTVKTLEPVFSVVLSKLVLGTATPGPVVATLLPIMVSFAHTSFANLAQQKLHVQWPGAAHALLCPSQHVKLCAVHTFNECSFGVASSLHIGRAFLNGFIAKLATSRFACLMLLPGCEKSCCC